MSLGKEFEAYRSTITELKESQCQEHTSRVWHLPIRILAESIGFIFHPVVRLFNSPEEIIAQNKKLIEGHKGF